MAKRVTVATVREVLGIVGREALHELTGAIGRRQLPQALATLNLLLEQGKDVKQVLTELIEYLRALVLYLAVPDYEEIYLTDTKEALAELAPLFDVTVCWRRRKGCTALFRSCAVLCVRALQQSCACWICAA